MKKITLFIIISLYISATYSFSQKVIFYKEKGIALDSITSYSSIDFLTESGNIFDPAKDTSSALIILAEKQIRNEVGYWKNMSDHGHMHDGIGMFGVKVGISDGGILNTNPNITKKLAYPLSKYVYIDIIQNNKVIFRGLSAFDSIKNNQTEKEKLATLIRAIFNKFISK